jgi:hypothetical protein
MDLRKYYRDIGEAMKQMTEKEVVICSLETPDGGRAGLWSEVPKEIAAKLVVERRARAADEEETAEYRKRISGGAKGHVVIR